MQAGFNALRNLLKEPLRADGGVKTDNSILLVYPPERELVGIPRRGSRRQIALHEPTGRRELPRREADALTRKKP